MTAQDSTLCIVGCGNKRYALGFCFNHYMQHRYGKDFGVEPVRARRKNGTGSINTIGYHVYGIGGEMVNGHIIVAERALGRKLKHPEVVHHVNGVRSDNRPENLVVCPDQAYHFLIHVRQRAYDDCGHADWRKCKFCKKYDDPVAMYFSGKGYWHRSCATEYNRLRRESKSRLE